jgi:hypothetical protein
MSLKELLATKGLTTALIIDDAYDEVPTAEDLSSDDDAWANFFADLGSGREAVSAVFPEFDRSDASDLKRNDTFVAKLWELRSSLKPELWNGLFERYVNDGVSDRRYLDQLKAQLVDLGLAVVEAGRSIPADGRAASIIFADLFLGSGQIDGDIETSIQRLRHLLDGRESRPPIVILMSRSSRLQDKKSYFRDEALLLGAMFRVYSKQDLLDRPLLERTLERLAQHYDDGVRLAAFLQAWNAGLESAKQRFLTTIRRLDLADYGQINELLLNFEGQPLGSYLLDVFGGVLEHEIEGDSGTIAAAEELKRINVHSYPPPYVAGSADLQDLVYRSLYQNPERMRVTTTTCGAPVAFGDVLIRRLAIERSGTSHTSAEDDDVLLVLTPACDLARLGVKRVLMIGGDLEELTPAKWIYRDDPVRTPIIKLPNGRSMWIRWNLKGLRTMTPTELSAVLAPGGSYVLNIRLRESQALELQQKTLSDLGRVGVLAPMPATFPVSVEASYITPDGALKRFSTPVLDQDGGVCFAGRDKDSKPIARLVLSEGACDELVLCVSRLDVKDVHPKAIDTLKRLKDSNFGRMLEQGLAAPRPDLKSPVEIKAVAEEGKTQAEVLGLIVRNPSSDTPEQSKIRHAALWLVLRDLGFSDDEEATRTTGSSESVVSEHPGPELTSNS